MARGIGTLECWDQWCLQLSLYSGEITQPLFVTQISGEPAQNLGRGKMFDFRRATGFLLGTSLLKPQND